LLNLIESTLITEEEPKLIAHDVDLMNALIIWCFAWSIGGNLVDESRPQFNEWCRIHFSSIISSKFAEMLYHPDSIYNAGYIDLTSKELKSWNSLIPTFQYDPTLPYFSILVPTMDTTRYRYLLQRYTGANHNVLFMAETGVGKSVVINSFLNECVATGKVVSYVMGYSAQTKPANLRDVFETKLEKKRKNLLGPPAGKKMMMFIDDLNMPSLEKYGAQPPNELLRQVC
jgi:dynein heavy chain